jgi:hypothetical protein
MKKIEFFKTELLDWNRNKIKRNALLCIAGVAALCILARAYSNMGSSSLSPQDLIKEASRCLKLAVQDNDKSIAMLHSAEGLAYLKLARKLASDSSLEKSTGTVAKELERVLNDIITSK